MNPDELMLEQAECESIFNVPMSDEDVENIHSSWLALNTALDSEN